MEIKLEYWWNDWIVSSGSVFGRDVLVLLDEMVFLACKFTSSGTIKKITEG
jgi:hypothetical protein